LIRRKCWIRRSASIDASIGVHNNNVVMRVVVRVMMPVMVFVDDHGWFVSDNDFIGTHHGCERYEGSEN
jgi:hypothetical protein